MSRTPREPQQRKGESWADFCRRHDAWRLSPERRRLRAFRRWQRMYRQEIRASIEAEKEKLRDKNGEHHTERHNRVHYDEPVMRGELIRVILPVNPSLPQPTPSTTALHCNEAGLRYLQPGSPARSCRPDDRPTGVCTFGRTPVFIQKVRGRGCTSSGGGSFSHPPTSHRRTCILPNGNGTTENISVVRRQRVCSFVNCTPRGSGTSG